MLLRKCQDECTHLVLVRLSLGDGLAIVGVPLGGALGEPFALAILHHIDTLEQDFSCIYFSYKVVLWLASYISFNVFSLWSYVVIGLQEGANGIAVTSGFWLLIIIISIIIHSC